MARNTEIRYINYYMSGSAAYQVESAPIKKPVNKPVHKARKAKKILVTVDPMATVGIVVAFVMLILMVAGVAKLNTVQESAEQMGAYVQTLQAENKRLEKTYHESYDLEEIRQIALSQGMVPAEQVQQVTLQVSVPTEQENPSVWDNFLTLLTGLFA